MFRDLGANISKTAASSGFSVVRSYCGHGIGDLFHTAPNVPHYPKNKVRPSVRPSAGRPLRAPLSPTRRRPSPTTVFDHHYRPFLWVPPPPFLPYRGQHGARARISFRAPWPPALSDGTL